MKSIKIYIIVILILGTVVGGFIFINKTNKTQKNKQNFHSVDETVSDKEVEHQKKEEEILETDNLNNSEETQKNKDEDSSEKKNNSSTSSKNNSSNSKKENDKTSNTTSSNKQNNDSNSQKEQSQNNGSASSNSTNNNSTDKKKMKCYPRKITIDNVLPPNQVTSLWRNENTSFNYKLSDYCYYGDDGKIRCGDIGCTAYDDTVTFSVEDSRLKVNIDTNNKKLIVNHTWFDSFKVYFQNKMGEEIGSAKFSGRCRPVESLSTEISEIRLQYHAISPQNKLVSIGDFVHTGASNCSRSNLNFLMSIDDTSIANFKSNGINIYRIWGRKAGTTTARFKFCTASSSTTGCAETAIKIVIYE